MPPIVVHLDDAIIITFGDARQPPCSCIARAYQASVALADALEASPVSGSAAHRHPVSALSSSG